VLNRLDDDAAYEEHLARTDPAALTAHYAGPFCGCGDYSCPVNDDPSADCVNRQW